MRIAFFGSPDFVVSILSHLHKNFGVSLVVSQPDKRVGRKQILTPTPVKQCAIDKNIPFQTPSSLKGFKLENIDIAIVAAYGLIFPRFILSQPKYGFINVHYSLLPKYRGASPVQTTIVNGEKTTGTTIMKMDEELDHGDIIAQNKVAIDDSDTSDTLLNKLNDASVPLLDQILQTIERTGTLPKTTKQDHSQATFTQRLTKEDGFIEFNTLKTALKGNTKIEKIHNIIRGYFPWPGAWTILPNRKRLKLISSEVKDNKLIFKQVQLEGKQKTTDTSFLKDFLE